MLWNVANMHNTYLIVKIFVELCHSPSYTYLHYNLLSVKLVTSIIAFIMLIQNHINIHPNLTCTSKMLVSMCKLAMHCKKPLNFAGENVFATLVCSKLC